METQFKLGYIEALAVLDLINAWIAKHGNASINEDLRNLTTDLEEYTNLICEKYGVEEGE